MTESLKLLTIHFNTAGTEISQGLPTQLCVHAIQNTDSDEFTTQVKKKVQ